MDFRAVGASSGLLDGNQIGSSGTVPVRHSEVKRPVRLVQRGIVRSLETLLNNTCTCANLA